MSNPGLSLSGCRQAKSRKGFPNLQAIAMFQAGCCPSESRQTYQARSIVFPPFLKDRIRAIFVTEDRSFTFADQRAGRLARMKAQCPPTAAANSPPTSLDIH